MTHYSLIIIGGGIHGVGVAQAAAAAGHSALLIEKSHLAAGTSSRSSKLIHGGLRYLQTAQLRLVYESLHERARLLQLAPELVRLAPFHIPIYKQTRLRPWKLRAALSTYALLAGLRQNTGFTKLPTRHWHDLDGLDTSNLQAVFRYHDGQTDDAALTAAVMRSAQQLGAQLAAPATFLAARLQNNTNNNPPRHEVDYQLPAHNNPRTQTASASVIINAAGPWAAQVAQRITPAPTLPPTECVLGSHILLPSQPQRGNYYVQSPTDARAVFIMPFKSQTLVGTTESAYTGDPDRVTAPPHEQQYLLDILAHYFPAHRRHTLADITQSIAGLRVLPAGPGRAFTRPRQTLLNTDRPNHPRVISILGGKLTTYRLTAQKVIQLATPSLPTTHPIANTANLPLTPN